MKEREVSISDKLFIPLTAPDNLCFQDITFQGQPEEKSSWRVLYHKVVPYQFRLQIFRLRNAARAKMPPGIGIADLDNLQVKYYYRQGLDKLKWDHLGGEKRFLEAVMALLQPDDVILDIGAYHGLYSLFAAKKYPSVQVYCLEPCPSIATMLENNIKLNNLDGQVKVLQIAAADKEGQAVLFHDPALIEAPSLSNSRRFSHQSPRVRLAAIDALIAEESIPYPTIVKMDIEGSEGNALLGMRKLLASSYKPRSIFLEIHPWSLADFNTGPCFLGLLHQTGYEAVSVMPRNTELLCHFQFNSRRLE